MKKKFFFPLFLVLFNGYSLQSPGSQEGSVNDAQGQKEKNIPNPEKPSEFSSQESQKPSPSPSKSNTPENTPESSHGGIPEESFGSPGNPLPSNNDAQGPKKTKDAFFLKKIVLIGNQCITLEDVLKDFPSSPKERLYTPEMLNEIFKNISDHQWFSSISFEIRHEVLYITVKENKFLNEVVFQGYENTEDLQKIVAPILRPYQNVDEEQLQRAKKAILQFLESRGKISSNIFVSSVPRHGGRIDVLFDIHEGEKTYIRDIQFVGNKHFSHKELMNIIRSKVAGFWRINFPPEELYNAQRIDGEDTQNLVNFYKSRGYLDISIEANGLLNTKKNGVQITFTISEGMRYDFGKTTIVSHVPGIDVKKVEKNISWKPGQSFNAMIIKGLDEWMSNYWSSEGRPFINIIPEFQREAGGPGQNPKVHVVLNIRQMPRSFVGNIFLSGNRRTKDYVIHNMLSFAPGDPLNAIIVKRSYEQLQASDFFNSVEVLDNPTDFPDRRDITIKVKEKSTLNPMLQVFYTGTQNQKDYGLMLQMADTNFLGRAWPAQIMASIKRRGWDLGGSVTIPNMFNRQIDWSTRLNFSSYKGYIRQSTKIENKKEKDHNDDDKDDNKQENLGNITNSFTNSQELIGEGDYDAFLKKSQDLHEDLSKNKIRSSNEDDKKDDDNKDDDNKKETSEETVSGPQYREYSAGLSSTLIFPLSPRFSNEIGISVAESKTTVNPKTSRLIQDNIEESPTIGVAGLINRLNYNRRLPPGRFFSNWYASWRFALMGGTVGYVTNSFTVGANAFMGPGNRYNLRLSATYSQVHPFGYMRFNNQITLGDGTFLGFNPAGIGPRDANTEDAFGGRRFYTAYARFYVPLDIIANFPTKIVFFFQSGSLWDSIFEDDEDVLGNDFANRSAAGVGLSFSIPFSGPIFVGWSKTLQKEDYDSPSSFVLVMGLV